MTLELRRSLNRAAGLALAVLAALTLLSVMPGTGALALAAPSAETGVASVSATTRVTLNGAVTPAGSTVVYAFEYGTTTAYGQRTPEVELAASAPKTKVKTVLTGLSRNATYHYRLVARDAQGTDVGRDRTFTTSTAQRAPSASTLPAAPVGGDRATLVARVNPSGLPTTYRFEWGPTTKYGSSTPIADAGSGSAPTTVTFELTGLNPGAAYHYRVVASNAAGADGGGNRSFRTTRGLTGISFVSSANTVRWGGSVDVSGAVAGRAISGARVSLLRQDFPFTAPFRAVASTQTGADGRYSFKVQRFFSSARVKAQSTQSPNIASPAITIGSQLYLRVRVERRRRASVRLSGRVFPARRDGRVRIERMTPSGAWRAVRTVQLRPRGRGRSGFRVTVPRLKRATTYRAVVDPRDRGAHVVTTSTPIALAARR